MDDQVILLNCSVIIYDKITFEKNFSFIYFESFVVNYFLVDEA